MALYMTDCLQPDQLIVNSLKKTINSFCLFLVEELLKTFNNFTLRLHVDTVC